MEFIILPWFIVGLFSMLWILRKQWTWGNISDNILLSMLGMVIGPFLLMIVIIVEIENYRKTIK